MDIIDGFNNFSLSLDELVKHKEQSDKSRPKELSFINFDPFIPEPPDFEIIEEDESDDCIEDDYQNSIFDILNLSKKLLNLQDSISKILDLEENLIDNQNEFYKLLTNQTNIYNGQNEFEYDFDSNNIPNIQQIENSTEKILNTVYNNTLERRLESIFKTDKELLSNSSSSFYFKENQFNNQFFTLKDSIIERMVESVSREYLKQKEINQSFDNYNSHINNQNLNSDSGKILNSNFSFNYLNLIPNNVNFIPINSRENKISSNIDDIIRTNLLVQNNKSDNKFTNNIQNNELLSSSISNLLNRNLYNLNNSIFNTRTDANTSSLNDTYIDETYLNPTINYENKIVDILKLQEFTKEYLIEKINNNYSSLRGNDKVQNFNNSTDNFSNSNYWNEESNQLFSNNLIQNNLVESLLNNSNKNSTQIEHKNLLNFIKMKNFNTLNDYLMNKSKIDTLDFKSIINEFNNFNDSSYFKLSDMNEGIIDTISDMINTSKSIEGIVVDSIIPNLNMNPTELDGVNVIRNDYSSNIDFESLKLFNKSPNNMTMLSMMDSSQFDTLITSLEKNSKIISDGMNKNPEKVENISNNTLVSFKTNDSKQESNKEDNKLFEVMSSLDEKMSVMINALVNISSWVNENRTTSTSLRPMKQY